MKKFIFIVLLAASCQKASNQTWENIKTAGCYFKKSVGSLIGKNTDSDAIEDPSVFLGPNDEYVALNEKDISGVISQSKIIPGKNIPELSHFQTPEGNYSFVFKKMHFDTDDHIIRGQEDLSTIQKIANFMKKHPKIFLSIEGHCDERASAGYNMALGARRANHVRVLLIKQGVDFNRLYTVSFGKEKPIALGHTSSDWRKNRRVEFKIYER